MPKTSRRGSLLPLILMIAGGLLIVGAIGWSIFASQRGAQISQTQTPSEDPLLAIPRISPGDAKAAYETGQAVIVDVRDAQTYAQSHIAGAISIPIGELADRVGELNPSDWIITY